MATSEDIFFFFGGGRVAGGSDGKESACNSRDLGLIPGLGKSPGKGTGNPLQDSCLENTWTEEPSRLTFLAITTREVVLSASLSRDQGCC